jgi:hypothetical protein
VPIKGEAHKCLPSPAAHRWRILIGVWELFRGENMRWRYAAELRKHPVVQAAAVCTVAVALSMLLLTWVLRLDRAHLEVPLSDGGDVLLNSMLIKSLVDNGWVGRNPFLGAPYGTQFFDFPFYDNLDLTLMKPIAMFSASYGLVMNLFFLLTFPLTVVSSLLVLREFEVSYPSALVASLLFSFLPYHFERNEAHLFLSAYFLIPPMTMVILWIWMGDSPDRSQEPHRFSLTRRRIIAAAIICALAGSGNSYYTFFGCYLLCVGAVVSAIRLKSPARFAWGVGLAALVFTVLLINTSPSWIYAMRHGSNPIVAKRFPVDSEIYGLKMTHLLLPMSSHRVEFLKEIRQRYDQFASRGEGTTATLGLVGDLGFFCLLGWLFCAPRGNSQCERLNALAVLAFSALLLGTMGGLGVIFNYLVSPQFRAYNRISIYIAFFSLFGVALLFDAIGRWIAERGNFIFLWYGFLGILLCLGILDQTSPSFTPDYAELNARYQLQQKFIGQIEAAVPSNAMIFQLPNEGFPELAPIVSMGPYDELRGYLHSRSLRWSSGAMRGRRAALWPERNGLDFAEGTFTANRSRPRIDLRLGPQAVDALAFAGFSGIYIDRRGFWDLGDTITSQLQALLGKARIERDDRRILFFDLSSYAQKLRAKYTPEQWEAERRKVLNLSP